MISLIGYQFFLCVETFTYEAFVKKNVFSQFQFGIQFYYISDNFDEVLPFKAFLFSNYRHFLLSSEGKMLQTFGLTFSQWFHWIFPSIHLTGTRRFVVTRPLLFCKLLTLGYLWKSKSPLLIKLSSQPTWVLKFSDRSIAAVVFWSDPSWGGRNYILKRVFFVQLILADRYINRRELRLISLESLSSVEYRNKKIFLIFVFYRKLSRFKFRESSVNSGEILFTFSGTIE